jgi:hypothetical protein
MYERVPVQRVRDNLWHIYNLYRDTASSLDGSSDEKNARMLLLRGLINNLRYEKSRPSLRVLMELSRRVPLAIGGSFKLIGYQLEKMREVDFLLNGHRTRIIESYPFYVDRAIDLPSTLSEEDIFERNAFLSELVLRWQRQVPIRVLQGPDWQREGTFHVQIGLEDNLELSGIPPGSVLQIEPASAEERANPDPKAVYCLQFGNGYRCCHCTVFQGKLVLLPHNGRYAGPYEFLYPFLDLDLVNFLLRVPTNQLLRPGRRRSLMRRAHVSGAAIRARRNKQVCWGATNDVLRAEPTWGDVDTRTRRPPHRIVRRD